MADSYLDIGDTPTIFPFEFNWATRPTGELGMTRYFQQPKGGPTLIIQQNPETPIIFTAEVMIRTREQSYSFLSFIHERVGRVYNFWVKYPKTLFTLFSAAAAIDTGIYVHNNNFHLQGLGFERIFIHMSNGDIITRHVIDVTFNEETGASFLQFASPVGRELTLTNHFKIGRFLLCRFDIDEFPLAVETDLIYTAQLKFYELVKEYPE